MPSESASNRIAGLSGSEIEPEEPHMQQDKPPPDLAAGPFPFPTQYVSEAFADALLSNVRAHQAAILRLIVRKSANAISVKLRTALRPIRTAGRAIVDFWNIPTLGPGVRTDRPLTSVERWRWPT
jgi:hypothetical protein